jgi:hypothetical protein
MLDVISCPVFPSLEPSSGSGSQWQHLIDLMANQGVMDGPAISKENGDLFSSRAIDDLLLEVLEDLFGSN